MIRMLFAVVLGVVFGEAVAAQPKVSVKLTDATVTKIDHVYKKTPQGELTLHGFFPADWKATDTRPVIVFFFGGGWKNGSFTQFVPQAEYFASRGIVALSADYRIESKHKTTPDVCLEDAKSAIRWVRSNAKTLGVDPGKIIASGGSAGGHIAACTALAEGFNSPDDPPGVSSVPAALLLFNPALNLKNVVKNAKGENVAEKISPLNFLSKSAPPTWLVFGDADPMLSQAQEYHVKSKKVGADVVLSTAPKQPHGFFNRSPWIESTTHAADAWLTEKGYLKGPGTLKPTSSLVRENP